MKKLLTLTLALLMLCTVVSCTSAKKPQEDATATKQDTQTQAPTTTEKQEEVTTREPWKPPVITDEPTVPDNPPADPLAAPTTFPDGTLMEIIPVTDGTLQKTDGVAAGTYATELPDKTKTIFDGGKTVKVSDYLGFLVKVSTENENGVYMRFKFKVKDGDAVKEVEVKANNRTIGWYREGAWNDFQGAASNWVTPASTGGYVYLPFALVTELQATDEITDIQVYSSNGSNRIGVFSEWSLVNPGNDDPRKLSDDTPIVLERITDGTLTADGTAEAVAYSGAFAGTTKTIFDGGAKVNVKNYKGVMVKVTTTTENHYGLYLHFFVKLADGTEVEIKAASRSYEWFDGTKWTTVSGAAQNWVTPNEESVWVYIPFPLSEITTDEITDIAITSAKSAARLGTFSEFSFVKATGEGGTPVDNKPKVPELAAPARLADDTKIELVPISDGILSAAGTNISGYASNLPYQTTTIFTDGAKIDISGYSGIMIKVATSTENHAGLYMRFFFKLADGTEVEVKALGRPIQCYNGTAWATYESGETASNWVTPSEEVAYLYFAFPFSEITTNEITDFRIYSSGSKTRLGTFSDWSFVKTVAD